MAVKLEAPRLKVEFVNDELDDVEIATHMGDMVAYEKQAKKEGWPGLQNGAGSMIWMNYLSFVHLKRAGQVDAQTRFDSWIEGVRAISNLSVDGDESDEIATEDPTQPVPVTG